MIIDPRPMNVLDWTDRMALLTDKYGPSMKLTDSEEWRIWGANVNTLIGLSDATVNPYAFDDWLSWAIRWSDIAESLLQ